MSGAPKLKDLGFPGVVFGERSTGPAVLHPEHIDGNGSSDSLRPLKDRIPVGNRDFKRLFDKINLTHATHSTESLPSQSNRAAGVLLADEQLTSINIADINNSGLTA